MTGFHITALALLTTLQAAAWLCCGVLIGATYFWTLRLNISLLASGRAPLLALGLQAGRFLLLGGLLAAIAARCGVLPLLSAAAGVLAARTFITPRLRVPT